MVHSGSVNVRPTSAILVVAKIGELVLHSGLTYASIVVKFCSSNILKETDEHIANCTRDAIFGACRCLSTYFKFFSIS